MKIAEKIKESNDGIVKDIKAGNHEKANALGKLAAEAMFDGIKSRKWKEYMNTYITNQKQLERLCGEDAEYLANDDNKRALAYIVGNSICTVDTRGVADDDDKQGTLNYLKPEMIEALDAGLSATPDTSASS